MTRIATTRARVVSMRCDALVWVTAAVIVAATMVVIAAPGVLDPTFNGNGIVRSSISGGAANVAIDHLGRIIVAGSRDSQTFFIARYNTNGASLDLTFGNAGIVLSQTAGIERVRDVVVDTVGRIVIAGVTRADGGDEDFAIARFNSNGALDVTFNAMGYTIVGFGGEDAPSSMLIDSTGRIVVAGDALTGDCDILLPPIEDCDDFNTDFAILRLTPGGELDESFAGDGKALTRFGDWEAINDIAIDALGRIIAVGTIDGERFTARQKQQVAIARYRDDGSLDRTFDGDGKASRNFGTDWSEAAAVAIDANGGIVVGGYRANFRPAAGLINFGGLADFVLARFNDDGTADATFGDNGLTVTNFGGGFDDLADAMAIDAAGRILLAGSSASGGPDRHDFAIARFSSTGVLDVHFGNGGMTTTAFPDFGDVVAFDSADGIALDSQQRIVLAGATMSVETFERFVALARYTPDRPDFSLDPIPDITVAPGATGSTTVTVNSIDGFELPLQLELFRTQTGGTLPAGVTSPGLTVTPVAYGAVTATLQVGVSAAVMPTLYQFFLFDTDYADHFRRVRVNVVSTAQSTAAAVGTFTDAGWIQSGVATALTAKLTAAQSLMEATQTQPAVNTLSAFINQVEAQSGKQIATSATLDGLTFNPAAVLIAQARGVIASLASEGSAAPLMGYVVTATQSAVRGATVAIVDATNAVIATAVTDATGFYFFPATNTWTTGAGYVAKVVGLPAGFTSVAPASQAFTWEGNAGMLDNFVVN